MGKLQTRMAQVIPEMKGERQARALTGVPTEKLPTLEAAFALALDDEKRASISKRF